MAAAASSDIFSAFPSFAAAATTAAAASFNSDAAFPTNILASTAFGCPESDFVSLGAECQQSYSMPSCLAAAVTDVDISATVDYNAACCTSISVWGENIESCLVKNAPACLDTSAIIASATEPGGSFATESNPCAPYWGGGIGAGPKQTPGPSTKAGSITAATNSGTSSGGSTAETTATGTSSGGSTAETTATGTSSGGSTAQTKASAATKTGAGLKVYLGLGLVGALAVLTM